MSWTSLATTAANASGTTTLDPIGDSGDVLGGAKRYPNGLTGTSGYAPLVSANLFHPEYTEHTADLTPSRGGGSCSASRTRPIPGRTTRTCTWDDIRIVDGAGTPLGVGITNPDDVETKSGWTSGGTPGFSWVTADTAG